MSNVSINVHQNNNVTFYNVFSCFSFISYVFIVGIHYTYIFYRYIILDISGVSVICHCYIQCFFSVFVEKLFEMFILFLEKGKFSFLYLFSNIYVVSHVTK